jgi:predicted lipid-binding transport protein (Tim44 family)
MVSAMNLFVTRLTVLSALLSLLAAPQALAGAGGGSSGYGGGGGGGGGGFGGGGSGSGSGDGGPWWLWVIIGIGVLLFFAYGAYTTARLRKKRRERVRRTIAASAEASGDDAWFEAGAVERDAADLFRATQKAWHERDRDTLRALVGRDLMVEWERRLDDFDKKGWHNIVEVKTGPQVEYVGMTNREDDEQDRVTVRLEATMRDCVRQKGGAIINKDGAKSQIVSIAEYWTLEREGDRWIVVSIEQDAEGAHHLDAPLIPSPWSDEQGIRDETVIERAREDAPQGVSTAELADVDYAGDARKQALDLSLVDERFAPQVLEAAARSAMSAWAEAVDGDDTRLKEIAGDEAVHELLYGGDAQARTRLVVRGPQLKALRIAALDPNAEPATLTVEAEVSGRRYVENRDTLELVSGSRDGETTFTERWTMQLDGTGPAPWRIAATGHAHA